MNHTDNIELLKIYWEEWNVRNENFWKKTLQYFIAILFVSTLPITYHTLGKVNLPNISLYIFPIVSILLSIIFLWYCISEAYRIINIDRLVKKIIKDTFGESYSKNTLFPINSKNRIKNKPVCRIFNARLSIWIPIFLVFIEVLLSVYVICIITIGYLS